MSYSISGGEMIANQVKNITPEIILKLNSDFETAIHTRTLTSQAIFQRLTTLERKSEGSSSPEQTSAMPSSGSLKPPHK